MRGGMKSDDRWRKGNAIAARCRSGGQCAAEIIEGAAQAFNQSDLGLPAEYRLRPCGVRAAPIGIVLGLRPEWKSARAVGQPANPPDQVDHGSLVLLADVEWQGVS